MPIRSINPSAYSWPARVALAKRLRTMIPSESEFEGTETQEELQKAYDDFVQLTLWMADELTRRK